MKKFIFFLLSFKIKFRDNVLNDINTSFLKFLLLFKSICSLHSYNNRLIRIEFLTRQPKLLLIGLIFKKILRIAKYQHSHICTFHV